MAIRVIAPDGAEFGGRFLGYTAPPRVRIRVGFPVAESLFGLDGESQGTADGFRITESSLEAIRATGAIPPTSRKAPTITHSSALLSDDKLFRYELTRAWGDGSRMLFVMLNPSTADASVNDPTIRRCVNFAMRDGFSGIEVANLFAYRTAYPKELREAAAGGVDITGPLNDEALLAAGRRAANGGRIVIAWGSGVTFGHKSRVTAFKNRDEHVLTLLRSCGPVYRFEVSTVATPVPHPLMLPANAPITLLAGGCR